MVTMATSTYHFLSFQEKRHDREMKRLQESLNYAAELNDILIPASVEMLERHTPELGAKRMLSRDAKIEGGDQIKVFKTSNGHENIDPNIFLQN